MSQPLEHSSNGASSQTDTEYYSKLESKLKEKQIILINDWEEYMFLNIWFPLPYQFPKPYIMLSKVISNLDDVLPKPYEWTHDCIKDPKSTLSYIITNFNIDRVSWKIWDFPKLKFEQVYYSTYIDTSQYLSLQCLINITADNLQVQNNNALVQKWLEIQIWYARYQISDDLSPYLSQCIL